MGAAGDRLALRHSVCDYDLVVMSYETMRTVVEWVASIQWNYCILDEGHVVRNVESKVCDCIFSKEGTPPTFSFGKHARGFKRTIG